MKEDQGSDQEEDNDLDDEEKEDEKAKAGGEGPTMPTSKIWEVGRVKTLSQGFWKFDKLIFWNISWERLSWK